MEPTLKPFCASSPEAQALSDGDFWAAVYPQTEDGDYATDAWDCYGPVPVGPCLRCGTMLEADDYQQLRAIIDLRQEICDDCADETAEVPDNDPWDENESIM